MTGAWDGPDRLHIVQQHVGGPVIALPDSTAPGVLLAAADLIEQVGLLQGGNWPGWRWGLPYGGGPCDVFGAIMLVTGSERLAAAARGRLGNRLGVPIDVWNDAPGRTTAEVVAGLRTAAETALGRGSI
jgi:hypothetical protein